MKTSLGGWSRLWLVFVGITAIGITRTAINEFRHPIASRHLSSGQFVTYGIPPGTGFYSNRVKFPDGRDFPINAIDPATGKSPKPWDMDWSKETHIPKQRYVNWASILFHVALDPLLLLVVSWLLFQTVRWVWKGFQPSTQGKLVS